MGSSCKTSLNPSLNLSLAHEEISFSNSVKPAAQPGSFSSRNSFSSNVALSDAIFSAPEDIFSIN